MQREVVDPELRPGARVLYASHRLRFEVQAGTKGDEEPDGSRFRVLDSSTALAPGPGVVADDAFIGAAPGPASVPVRWIVTRSRHGEPETPFCVGSQALALNLLAPTPTTFAAKRLLEEPSGDGPRFAVNVAGGPTEDLSPLEVRIRKIPSGRRRTLFTLPLADVSARGEPGARRYLFTKRFEGMTITSANRDATVSTRGLLTVAVKMPKARSGRTIRRSFTLELARDAGPLLRLRTVIACSGFGSRYVLQDCRTPLYRVTRPTR